MKCFNPHTYEKLGFDVILRYLRERLHSDESRDLLAALSPTADAAVLVPELERVNEYRNLLLYDEAPPRGAFMAVGRALVKLQVQGNWLSAAECFDLLLWLRGVRDLRAFFKTRAETAPRLHALLNDLPFTLRLVPRLEQVFDERGQIRDDASPALAGIRSRLKSTAVELRNTLYRVLRRANENNWSLDREITLRNDRLVIPVKAESKHNISGFVQDVSQTGGTVYIEPAEALPLNNLLRELQINEHNEIVRILTALSQDLHQHLPELQALQQVSCHMDLLQAKARLAVDLGAQLPVIEPAGRRLHIEQAYYPLLQLKAQQDPFEVIPLEINLLQKNRIVLISGPNAGGKSVSLKTVGLLQLMLQSGLLVPVADTSVFPLFNSLFLDIGDEQSVDSDLSTYTSRLKNWRQMGDNMNSDSLFLIDEFGSGTDPKQGGAIAEAFLERFVRVGAFGIITTHYGNLKDYAEITPGVRNAAMQFDTQGLRPTFRLIEGMPGRSYAFEMAERVGVHPSILRKARHKVGTDEIDTEQLLKELERKNNRLEQLVAENNRREQKLQSLLERNQAREIELESKRKEIVNEAKRQARALIEQANKQIERTIREIREQQADKKKTLVLRRQLAASAPVVEPEPVTPPVAIAEKGSDKTAKDLPAAPELLPGEQIAAGDWVKLIEGETYGRLVELQGNRGILEAGDLRLHVRLNQLVKIRPPRQRKTTGGVQLIGDRPQLHARFELNVMGQRVEEVLPVLERFIDEARQAGLPSLRILHGKGSGVLRDVIRKQLADLPFVTHYGDAPVEMGGAGWTIVELGD
ncbi:MAG: endonuclease MutS2 [Bacteroidia bacterium]